MIDQEMPAEEHARLHSHWGGRASSLEQAAQEARDKAGLFFGSGSDDAARIWREVARWLDAKAVREREKQKEFA